MKLHRCLCVALLGCLLLGAAGNVRVRRPIGPDRWYPANPAALYQAIRQYTSEANEPARDRRLLALVAPSAGYAYSGAVAGHAYSLLQSGQYDRVCLITPSHTATFRGCSIAGVDFYRTPLGDVPLDGTMIRSLDWSPLISTRSLYYGADIQQKKQRGYVHETEHGIEVQLPFLQVQMGTFQLVPLVVSEFETLSRSLNQEAIASVAERLREEMDDRGLLVVSTNFTQYGPQYGITPPPGNALHGMEKLDAQAIALILDRDTQGLLDYIEETGISMPGVIPLVMMMEVLPKRAVGVLLAHDMSARATGDSSTSISYVAIAFFDPSSPPNEAKPVRTLVDHEPVLEPAPDTNASGAAGGAVPDEH